MSINWDDPAARFHLIDSVGPEEYERLQREHFDRSTLARVNGYGIRAVGSRFGTIYMIDGASIGFRTLAESEAHAATLPARDG